MLESTVNYDVLTDAIYVFKTCD